MITDGCCPKVNGIAVIYVLRLSRCYFSLFWLFKSLITLTNVDLGAPVFTENLDYEFLSAGNKDDEASDQIAFKQLTLEQAIPLDRICPSQVLKGVNEFTQKLTSVLDKV
ncbi:hypothetical protein Tco_0661527, partial [Tanacetum coccineum]